MNPRFAAYKGIMNSHYILGKWGAVHAIRDPGEDITSGNHHVIAAVHHKFLALMNMVDPEDLQKARKFIESTRDVTGVFNRAATKLEDQAHDDIMALCVSDYYLGLRQYAAELHQVGTRWTAGWMKIGKFKFPMFFKWYFDNTEETPEIEVKKWFGRFLWLPGLIKECLNDPKEGMSWWHRMNFIIYLLANVYFEKDPTSVSGRQLRWLTVDVIYRRGYRLTNWAIRKWRKRQEEVFGPMEPMADSGWNLALGRYYSPTHPFAIYGNDVWGLECRDA